MALLKVLTVLNWFSIPFVALAVAIDAQFFVKSGYWAREKRRERLAERQAYQRKR